jgi:hypothetical protein
MMTVETLIGDLLLQHNCVVVPNFGGFVAQRISAQLDFEKGVMLPARKSVLFNRSLVNNDGLLITALAQQNELSYPQSTSEVDHTVANWQQQLQDGQRISIDRVGILYMDSERNLCFEQDRFFNLLLESYGLSAVHFIAAEDVAATETLSKTKELADQLTVENETVADHSVPVVHLVEETRIVPIGRSRAKKAMRYVAAACLLPVVFYSVWIPMKTDVLESGVLTIHDFNPFYKVPASSFKSKGQYEIATDRVEPQLKDLPAHVSTFAYELDEDTYIPIRVKERGNYQSQPEVSSVELSEAVVEVPQNTSTPSASGSQVIVGSFSSRTNADILVQSLRQKGFDAVILESGSTIRVSAGSGSAYNTLAPKLRAEGLEPWLLK